MAGYAEMDSSKAFKKRSAELAFRPVIDATADKTGLDFMRHLVKNLAQSLHVEHAYVGECAGDKSHVKTIAIWSDGDWRENVEFPLAGMPCERVVAGESCLHRDDVQKVFPTDAELARLRVRGYLGVPLRGADGHILGYVAALATHPMDGDPRNAAIFKVLANRARIEMERLHAELVIVHALRDLEGRLESTRQNLSVAHHDLTLADHELQALLEINQSASRHLRRTDLFSELARSVKPLLPCERFGIDVPTGPDSMRVYVLALDQPSRGPMIEELPSAGTACRWARENRRRYVADSREELRAPFPVTHVVMEREGMESLCVLPLLRDDHSFGALFFMSTQRGAYRELPSLVDRVAKAVAVAVDHCFAYEELAQLRDRLRAENIYLQEEIKQDHNFAEIVGRSPALSKVLALVETVASAPSTVLILGETGTGKELVARAIHDRSPRSERPLVKVNCSAIAAGLVESELFGHVRGAFTGATSARTGRFEVADGGTIFLDEVGDLPLETQVKLLRALQEREFEPVGSSRARRVDVRVIAATNRNLEQEVVAGRFRADLFFRLNVVPIVMPPLRERKGDIALLAEFFADRFAREFGKRINRIAPDALQRLLAYSWPGNVRELSNVIERAVVVGRGRELEIAPEWLSQAVGGAHDGKPAAARLPASDQPDALTLEQMERRYIEERLERTAWVIEGERGAAATLGLSASTLRSRMKKLGVRRPQR